MTKRYKPPIVIDYTEHTWKEVEDIKKENEQLKNIAKVRYDNNKTLMTKFIDRGKTIKRLNKDMLHKDAMIRQCEKIIYKLYMDKKDELSTGDVHNIIRIADKYSRGDFDE